MRRAQTVATAGDVLAEVRDSAQALTLLLMRAEAAILAVRRDPTSR